MKFQVHDTIYFVYHIYILITHYDMFEIEVALSKNAYTLYVEENL